MAGKVFKVEVESKKTLKKRPAVLSCAAGRKCLGDGFIYPGQAKKIVGRGESKKPWHLECFDARCQKSRTDAMYRRIAGSFGAGRQ